jgi:hypothetical protein
MRDRDANDAEGNKSINTEQLESIIINDWDNSLLPNITIASCDAEPIGNKGQVAYYLPNEVAYYLPNEVAYYLPSEVAYYLSNELPFQRFGSKR